MATQSQSEREAQMLLLRTALDCSDEQQEAVERALARVGERGRQLGRVFRRRAWGLAFGAQVERCWADAQRALALLAQRQALPAPARSARGQVDFDQLSAEDRAALVEEFGDEARAREALGSGSGWSVVGLQGGSAATIGLRWPGELSIRAGELHVELAVGVTGWTQAGLGLPPARYEAVIELLLNGQVGYTSEALYPSEQHGLVRLDGIVTLPEGLLDPLPEPGHLPTDLVRVRLEEVD